jgi:hypothetical protein
MGTFAFICGSLEDGKDGVGDYTRVLASRLNSQGHQTLLLSFNDRHISEVFVGVQHVDAIEVNVLRIPESKSIAWRINRIKEELTRFQPDLISLQFVPFSYQRKGIPIQLASQLLQLGKEQSWHLMFHEVWVGHAEKIYAKKFWLGQMQKIAIKRLVTKLKPIFITTHAPYYRYLLDQINVSSQILPLFGNMPVSRADRNRSWEKIKRHLVNKDQNKERQHFQLGVIFGTIPTMDELSKVGKLWMQSLKNNDKDGILVLVGRQSSSVDVVRDLFSKAYPKIQVASLGPLCTKEISHILQECDFGISPVPFAILQKSGTIAAMLEHGLKVVVTRMGKIQSGFHPSKVESVFYIDDLTEKSIAFFKAIPPKAILDEVAIDFVEKFILGRTISNRK